MLVVHIPAEKGQVSLYFGISNFSWTLITSFKHFLVITQI